MGSVTSEVILNITVNNLQALTDARDALAALEDAAQNGINIKLNSADVKKMEKTLTQMNTKLGKLVEDADFSKMFDSMTSGMKDALAQIKTDLQDVSSGKAFDTSKMQSDVDTFVSSLDGAITKYDEFVNLYNNGSKTGNTKTSSNASKELEKESKSIQKSGTSITRAVNGINTWVATDQFVKNTKEMESALKEYNGVQSDAYKGMEESYQKYKEITDTILDETENGARKLEADSEEAKAYVKQFDDATTAYKKFGADLKAVKIDAKDTGFKTLSEQAKEADKEVQSAVQSIINIMGGNQWQKTAKNVQDTLDKYQNFDLSELDTANEKLTAFEENCQNINTTLGDIQAGASVDEVYSKLSSSLNDSEIINYANQLTSLEKDIPGLTKSISAQLDDFVKVQDDLNKGFSSRNGFSKTIDNMENSLSGIKDLDIPAITETVEKVSDLKDSFNTLSENASRNGGSINLSELLGMDGWNLKDAKEYPNIVQSTAKEIDELGRSLKGIDTSNLSKITNGEMSRQLDDFKNSISGMSDGYAKANLNGMAQDMERLYGSAQSALGSGTAQGYAEASRCAEEFTQKAQEANQAYQQFMLGSGTSAGGGGTGGGGGGNVFMSGFTSGNGGSSGSWFSGFSADLSKNLSSAATYMNRFLGYNAIYREARQAAQEMVQTVEEIDTAMNQLQIVTGANESEMSDFFESSVSQAKDLGQSVTDVLDTIQVYSRLGYNLEDASELTEYTSILANVAAVDIEDATSGLTSVIKGLKISSFFFNCWKPLRALHTTTW